MPQVPGGIIGRTPTGATGIIRAVGSGSHADTQPCSRRKQQSHVFRNSRHAVMSRTCHTQNEGSMSSCTRQLRHTVNAAGALILTPAGTLANCALFKNSGIIQGRTARTESRAAAKRTSSDMKCCCAAGSRELDVTIHSRETVPLLPVEVCL